MINRSIKFRLMMQAYYALYQGTLTFNSNNSKNIFENSNINLKMPQLSKKQLKKLKNKKRRS